MTAQQRLDRGSAGSCKLFLRFLATRHCTIVCMTASEYQPHLLVISQTT